MPGRLTQELLDTSTDLRIIRSNVSWETYERLLAENWSNNAPRFAFDRGTLEISRFTAWQESTNRTLAFIVELVARELQLPIRALGSSTCRHGDLQCGFNPDSSFYIRNASRIHGRREIELPHDPPPDLIIDIRVADRSMDKTPLFAAFGVPEVWQYAETTDRVAILRLRHRDYHEKRESAALVPLTSDMLTSLVRESRVKPSHVWSRELQSWMRNYD